MKFTIRDLLWLILLAAVVVAWRADRAKLATDLPQLDAEVSRELAAARLQFGVPRDYAWPADYREATFRGDFR